MDASNSENNVRERCYYISVKLNAFYNNSYFFNYFFGKVCLIKKNFKQAMINF